MLDDRKAAILSAVVQQYIETAQPVGSSRVASSPGVEVSSATVRNEMAALEDQGYLVQPHTSAGRIPTDKGYRFFVDHLGAIDADLPPDGRREVREFFANAHGEIESTLARTSELLSHLTDWTAVVVAPDHDVATVRSAQLIDLSSHVVMVVAVLSSGVVEKRTIEVPVELTPEMVADASRRFAAAVDGRRLGELHAGPEHGDDVIVAAAVEALGAAAVDATVFVGGAYRVASAFDAVEQVREVLTILEQQLVVVSLIRDVLDRGLQVAIGEETGLQPLAECSLVVAPYRVDGGVSGTIGVLGPTRMDYAQALSAVAVVSRRLGDTLGEG